MAERAGKIRSLLVRPIRSADVAFNMAGVIDLHNQALARLGAYVAGFSLNRLYTDIETEIASHARDITFTADEIRERLEQDSVSAPGGPIQNHVLFSLRNESLRATLEQAILRRDNAFRDKYQFRSDIADLFAEIYKTNDWKVDPDSSTEVSPDSKVGRLLTLQKASRDRFLKIRAEYIDVDNKNDGVALSTDTDTTSRGRTINESSITATIGNRTQGTYEAGALHPTTGARDFQNDGFFRTAVNALAPDPNGIDQVLTHDKQDAKPIMYTGDGAIHTWDGVVARPETPASWVMTNRNVVKQVGLKSDGGGGIIEAGEMSVVQTATTKHRTYTFPRRENDEEFQRTQLGLQDEILDEKITTMGVPEMEKMMTNELEIMDWEINKLQLNYAHTYLVPPFDGVVTAVYKDLGESVVAGEPVLRIEDHTRLLLVGRVQFRGVLRLDDPNGAAGKVRIRTTSLFEDGQAKEFQDVKIVSIRGHDADNDEYDLILELKNPTIDPGDDPDDPKTPRVLPINYHFDRDDTEIFFDV
jgi:hypothetical protein